MEPPLMFTGVNGLEPAAPGVTKANPLTFSGADSPTGIVAGNAPTQTPAVQTPDGWTPIYEDQFVTFSNNMKGDFAIPAGTYQLVRRNGELFWNNTSSPDKYIQAYREQQPGPLRSLFG